MATKWAKKNGITSFWINRRVVSIFKNTSSEKNLFGIFSIKIHEYFASIGIFRIKISANSDSEHTWNVYTTNNISLVYLFGLATLLNFMCSLSFTHISFVRSVCAFFLFYFMSFLMFVIISIQFEISGIFTQKNIRWLDVSAKYRVRPHSHLHIWYNVCVSVWLGIRSMAYGKCLSGTTLHDWYVHRQYDCFQFFISNGSYTLSIVFRSVMGNL